MKNRVRIFPLLFAVTSLTIVLHTGNIISNIFVDDSEAESTLSHQYVGSTKAVAEDSADEGVEEADHEGDEHSEAGSEGVVTEQDSAVGPSNSQPFDPLKPQFTAEELEVLQSLSDRREALNKRERTLDDRERFLEATEKKISMKISELNNLKTELEELIGTQQEVQDERLKRLVKIYETMKPKDAARIFNDLQFDVLIGIVERMSERRTAPILAEMDAQKARYLSAKLAEQKALPKPELEDEGIF